MPKRTHAPSDDALFDRLQVFVDTWRNFEGTEQAGAQQFLQGLLDIYGASFRPGTVFEQHPVRMAVRTAAQAGQAGLFGGDTTLGYTTERMDMYLPKVCVWEMKAPSDRDLGRHHDQILAYWARVRTRYMVLCNFREFWIYDTDDEHGQLAPKLRFPIEDLPARGDALLFLKGEEPDLAARTERVTKEVASRLGRLVREVLDASRDPGRDKDAITWLILECVFAMFAEDAEIIPPGMFTQAMRAADEAGEMSVVWRLFDDFGQKDAQRRTNRFAPYVNGPLFDRKQPRLTLTDGQIHDVYCAARDYDWQDVRPEIFGSIFEQALDPVERHELGAHYTREADIARVVVPTVIAPWQERIASIRTPKDAERVVEQMRSFHVLDPACGCGNFLYVVYREMKRLEAALAQKWTKVHRTAAKRRADVRPPPPRPYFTIEQIHGIEVNGFAAFLARVVLWIGEALAAQELGLDEDLLPLKNLDRTIRHADALEVEWPRPAGELAIVSNPPYLGVRKLRREMGDEYVEKLFARHPDNRAADYVTYWFTRALEVLRPGERAGYVCTNSVAQNESREASIDRILQKGGTLTDAWHSYPWPGEAAVHIAIVNWTMAPYEGIRTLDGQEVPSISPSLTTHSDVTTARQLPANQDLCFMGVTPGNKEFVLSDEQRAAIIESDQHSSEVIRPFLIGRDVNREIDQRPTRWIIDFGMMEKEEAETYEGAMRHVRKHVVPVRKLNPRESGMKSWWHFWRPASNLRAAIERLSHVMVIPAVSPRLIVSRQPSDTCFDHQLMVVALDGDYQFGILLSRLHEIWARARGSTLEERLRYTNTTIFESFPFPPTGDVYDPRARPKSKAADRVAHAAKAFDDLRSAHCKRLGLGLTKLHNKLDADELPELRAALDELNDAVTACYGFPAGTWRDEGASLRLLLDLNHRIAGWTGAR